MKVLIELSARLKLSSQHKKIIIELRGGIRKRQEQLENARFWNTGLLYSGGQIVLAKIGKKEQVVE